MSNNENNTRSGRSVNVFDVLIPIILIACVVGLVLRSCSSDNGTLAQSDVTVYFTVRDVTQDVLDGVKENGSVYVRPMSDGDELLIGKITDNNIEDDTSLFKVSNKSVEVTDGNGDSSAVYYPDGSLCTANGRMTATGFYDANHGFMTDDDYYLTPGQEVTLYTETVVLNVIITKIEP